jgi:hypothetical protein
MNDGVFQPSLFSATVSGYSVERVLAKDAYPFLLQLHYARRIPSISHAFGLLLDGKLTGVVTYGTPPSHTLINGLCGPQWAQNVLELNRLVLRYNRKNEASRLVAASLRMLPRPSAVVSFADTAQGHEGVVYQSANFLYTGLSARFTDPVVAGLEHQHHATYANGLSNREVVEKYGADNVTFIERSRKHRYVYFVGTKSQRKQLTADLRYGVQPFPRPCPAPLDKR